MFHACWPSVGAAVCRAAPPVWDVLCLAALPALDLGRQQVVMAGVRAGRPLTSSDAFYSPLCVMPSVSALVHLMHVSSCNNIRAPS